MSRLAVALVLALAATMASAQEPRSGQSQTPAVGSGNGSRPFLFDARMPGDGSRGRAIAEQKHPNAGALVVPPKAIEPMRER